MQQPTIRLLIADASDLYREGLTRLFARDASIEVVAKAGNLTDMLRQATEQQPDVMLVDLHLPGGGAFVAVQRVHEQHAGIRAVLIARKFARQDIYDGDRLGVLGYITKDIGLQTLVEGLRTVAQGKHFVSAQITDDARVASDSPGRARAARLTDRQREILQLVARGATNREVARALNVTENTVKVHLRNILGKLHLQNRHQAAALAREVGIVKDDDGAPLPTGVRGTRQSRSA
jgi:two-component system nitrate/nitrite response regulator NarL